MHDPAEVNAFKKLVDYCRLQSTRGTPCLLIANNPNFEHTACLHSPRYNSEKTGPFICEEFGYASVDKFKSDEGVWGQLNLRDNSYETLTRRSKATPSVIQHVVTKNQKAFSITVKKLKFNSDSATHKSSNIHEFFDVVFW